jgi:hypothetical protein
MTLQGLQFSLGFVHLYFGENRWPAEDAWWRPMRRSLLRHWLMLCRGMGHAPWQRMCTPCFAEKKTTRIAPIRKIDECKAAFSHVQFWPLARTNEKTNSEIFVARLCKSRAYL